LPKLTTTKGKNPMAKTRMNDRPIPEIRLVSPFPCGSIDWMGELKSTVMTGKPAGAVSSAANRVAL
jgi:hypothetical protein